MIVVGGGIIGLSLSIELRKQGATVLLLERGEPGREASHAAGGMLVDSPMETQPALQALATASARMYPAFVSELEIESGRKIDLRDDGAIVFFKREFSAFDLENKLGCGEESLSPSELAELEPALAETSTSALFLKERSVDPRGLVAAAMEAAKRLGVDISSGEEVNSVHISEDAVTSVSTKKTTFYSPKVVNCAGAWSGQFGPHAFPTRPVKGQMLCLISPTRNLIRHVIRSPEVYIIPRSDGRIIIGTTVEEAGFDKRTEVAAIQRLHQAAVAVVPQLREAKILEDWAGLRPGTPDGLPILGATSTHGYYVATGHFRDGILLAPITARVMAQIISGQNPSEDLSAFSAERFQSTCSSK